MKKRFLAILFIGVLVAAVGLTACSQGGQSASSASSSALSEEATSASSSAADAGDSVETAAYKYLAEEVSKNFEKADASIPIVQIVAVDEANPDDVLVYGDFWVDNYNINGDTLECVSGGNFPGVMHMVKEGEGYTVSSFDKVADGADFDSSAKELFGENYDAFMKVYGDDETRNELRKEFVSDYVKKNGLDVIQFQDFGWDPVKLDK